MKHLHSALETAIKELGTRDTTVVNKLLETVDKMADALRPAVRQAVSPVGDSVKTLTVGDAAKGSSVTLDVADRNAIMAEEDVEVQDEKDYTVVITELDTETFGCRVAFLDDLERRFRGVVTDPVIGQPNNRYALALASRRPLTVRAKAITKDGEIDRLYISDSRDGP